MEKFTLHIGVTAPLIRINVDTDAIIPSREMKRVSKVGLADGLFAGWRYVEQGGRVPNPEFVLNRQEFRNASILLSGANFGCGSSREHAVWALKEYGFRAIIAPSFGAIFRGNCIRNGLLPIILREDVVRELSSSIEADPQNCRLTIDLQQKLVMSPSGTEYSFDISPLEQEMLLEGLDPIAITLKQENLIAEFQRNDVALRPWIYIDLK